MSWVNAFAPVEAEYRARVMESTWGRLAPLENKTYKGYIVFAIGLYGSDYLNPTVLACEFEGLDDSPWAYDSITEFLQEGQGVTEQKYEVGGVYRFDGTFHNYTFRGKTRKLVLVNKDNNAFF